MMAVIGGGSASSTAKRRDGSASQVLPERYKSHWPRKRSSSPQPCRTAPSNAATSGNSRALSWSCSRQMANPVTLDSRRNAPRTATWQASRRPQRRGTALSTRRVPAGQVRRVSRWRCWWVPGLPERWQGVEGIEGRFAWVGTFLIGSRYCSLNGSGPPCWGVGHSKR